jgi:hypothetical protein
VVSMIATAVECPDPGLSAPAPAGGPDIALAESVCPGWTRATVVFHDGAGHICGQVFFLASSRSVSLAISTISRWLKNS